MKIINFAAQETVVNKYMAELREVQFQKNRASFRHNLERIGATIAYEISRTMDYETKEIQTPLGIAPTRLYTDKIVLGTIFRAGLPFHQGFLDVFDEADNAFVSAYRFYKDKECHEVGIHIDYLATPDLTGKTLIIADPMLATGGSMELGLKAFECSVIYVYDWLGKLVMRYDLDVPVSCFCVDEKHKVFYGIANLPDPTLVKFSVVQ